MDCEKKSKYCDGQDIRPCQMKSASRPRNEYNGPIVYMCKQCRGFEQGQYKFVKTTKGK